MDATLSHPSNSFGGIKVRLLEWIIGGVITFCALSAGIYTGIRLGASSDRVSAESITNETFLALGDSMPNYTVWQAPGSEALELSTITPGSSRLIVMVQSGCHACEVLQRYWASHVIPRLRADITLVVLSDSANGLSDVIGLSQPGVSVAIGTVADDQLNKDGVFMYPTVIGAGSDSRIRFVMSGLDRRVNADFINETL